MRLSMRTRSHINSATIIRMEESTRTVGSCVLMESLVGDTEEDLLLLLGLYD